MDTIVQTLNTAGRAFVQFALPMLLQSSLLILLLLAADVLLRRRVRAVFRYWIWMLVLLKLVLPPSLWSPVSIGTWVGDELEVSTAALLEPEPVPPAEAPPAARPSPAAYILSSPDPVFAVDPEPRPTEMTPPLAPVAKAEPVVTRPAGPTLTWQGFVLLLWGMTVMALLLLLLQRAYFVQGLVAQAEPADHKMFDILEECRAHLGLRRPVVLRISPNATSPAVCGLRRPTILIPQNLASRLQGRDLRAVFLHELAHIRRGDLWINFAQTLLQIAYFYHPLLWLANAVMRRAREQAVDETVLVAMGETATQYPETLVNVAKLAFRRRPVLSLRLVGVVESKSALSARIKHMLSRPLPRTAKLGALGLTTIVFIAAVLLPMARGKDHVPLLPAGQGISRDTDGDGLSDFQEVHKYLTDPAKKDSDDDGAPDGDWNERREYAYSVRTVLRYLPPFDDKGLNDDLQDARVLKQSAEYVEVEVIHYPLATGYDAIAENPHWRRDYAREARLAEYLAPSATTNWDEQMRKDLLAALKADGIDVETLTDKQVVERVSSWLLKRSRYLDSVFTTYYVDFAQGTPRVSPGLEDAFRREFERDSRNYDWTIEQHFDHELLGKGMFYNKTHGSCTSTAIYLTTVLRALGIPTRMVLATPAVDGSDRAQVLMAKNAITHNRVRVTMLAGLGWASHGFCNHTFNEVYVGNRWCRLDYTQLGCSSLGERRFGLQTHLYTFNDLRDVNFAPTWGRRYAKGEHSDAFQHDNPYAAVAVSEQFGPHGNVPNPPFTAQDLWPDPKPNIFLFTLSSIRTWQEPMDLISHGTGNRTIRLHEKEYYDDLFNGLWLTRPQDILVLLFALDAPERVPVGYEDLLPKPWGQIESSLKRGETVELGGRARDLNVILLAAPAGDGLKALVPNSRLLRAIGGAGPAPSAAAAQPAALAPSPAKPAKLPNGVTVELLGVCEYPSDGKQWWRPDGSALAVAPYQTANNKRELKEGFRDYELVVRYGGAPDMNIQWDVPGSAGTGITGNPYGADGQRIHDLTVCTVRFPQSQTMTEVRVAAAAGAWETQATHPTVNREGTYSLGSGRNAAFGIAHFQEGRTLVPVTTNFSHQDINFRVVAVRAQGEACTGGLSGFGDGGLNSLTYLFDCPLSDIQEFRFQTRPWTWATFPNVALPPRDKTEIRTERARAASGEPTPAPAPPEAKVLAIGPACQALEDAVGGRYGGSVGGFSTEESKCTGYLKQVLSWTRPGDTFVLLFAFDMPAAVPASYQDLLPLPWSEIESHIRQGEQVEARGKARDLNVILLATPTLPQLNTLIGQTHLLDAFRSKPPQSVRSPQDQTTGQRRVVLPAADQRRVILDLATGELVPLPPVGPEPARLQEALRQLGKGDLLYDQDLGDHTLILWRAATSPQAQEDTGEASIRGHLIGPHLPEVLTVTTAEGRRYEVHILVADDKACTLTYSPMSREESVGGNTSTPAGKGSGVASPNAGAGPGPLGRHALSFDGVDDKLVVPPSASLTLKPPFFIEVWAKPDFSMLPEARPGRTRSEDEPWPEMSLIRQGGELRAVGSPSREAAGSDTDGWPVLRPPSVHGLNNVQSGGFMGFLLRRSGGLFAVRKDGRVMQGNIFRADDLSPGHPGWVHYYSFCMRGYLPEDYVPAAASLVIGGRIVPNGLAFKGEIAEVRLWNKQLTAEEIQRYRAVSLTGNEPNLIACWDFERQAGGQVVYDLTPSHNDARLGTGPGKDDDDPAWVDLSNAAADPGAKQARNASVIDGSSGPAEKTLKQLLEEAQPGAVVTVPRGRYTTPVEITRPVVLRGQSQESCIIEVTADQPAVLINAGSQGDVTMENLTIQWQLATDKPSERPAALLVKDTTARIHNCRFVPLGDARRSPTAVYIDGRSKSIVDNCRFNGFEYTICQGPGTEGVVQDCLITDCGHQGVIAYDGATLTVQRCVITGSKFHAVRCTGGTLHVKDNLLINNANRGIYLGNKTGQGTITNNVILGNGTGISGFGRAEYAVTNNVILRNSYAGIDMRDSCRLTIRNNVLVNNQRGVKLFKEGAENSNVLAGNTFWSNATDMEDIEEREGTVKTDPQFADPNHGDFSVRGRALARHGLMEPQVIQDLWRKYEQAQRERSAEATQPTRDVRQTPSQPAPPAEAAGSKPANQAQNVLKRLMDEARPGAAVMVPKGRYTTPVEITKPVVLRGESQEGCIIEVTADQPAVLINTGGQGEVTIENMTVQWQLATDKRIERPTALLVKDTNARIRNCRFLPLGDYRRCPTAVYIDGRSNSTVDNCRFSGFEYTVCYGPNTQGVVQDCLITDCGHQGVINYDGATLTVQRCIITGSKFHALRCTGGTLDVKDNLLIRNANRGIYLGNKTGRGTITNNVILGNGSGISGFGRADYAITNNVIMDNQYAGIDMRDSCRFSIRNNVLAKNQRGLVLFKEGAENFNTVGKNAYWANATDGENLDKPQGSLTADPQFAEPDQGDFTVRGSARDEGQGLTNPQVIRQLWAKYEQLQRERPPQPATRAEPVSPAAQGPSQSSTALAWQRTDVYVPPDPNGFFPDDPEGGKKLDVLFQATDKDSRSDEEILSTVRQGLRRTSRHRTLVLRWVGNRYIWGKDPQNAQAIEIMYHAVPLERYYAVYFGLSVAKDKTPNILHTLADICLQADGQTVGRITWGLGSQREQLLSYIAPHLQDGDPARREIAQVLVKHFRGELDFEQWQRDRHLEQVKAQFGSQLPQFRETLRTGVSEARYQVLTTMLHNQIGPLLDDSFLPAMQAAADDPDQRVRNEVARVAGHRWVWSAPKQDPNAIALMLKLSSDSNREVRYNAVYYGLSVVHDKCEPVVRRLVELALSDHESNLYGRIIWGFRDVSETQPDPLVKILAEYLGRAKSDTRLAASVYSLYREILGKEPPDDWGLAQVRPQYPDDLFIVPFSAREPFQPENADALWNEFTRALPAGATADRLPVWWDRSAKNIGEARIRGQAQAETVRHAIANHPRLRAGEIRPLPLSMQLYLEEMHGVAPRGTQGAPPKPSTDAGTSAPSPAPAQGPGPVQQRINEAAPGATVRLEPGLYKESLVINKPLTLEGTGWDKTVIVKERMAVTSLEDIEKLMAQRMAGAQTDAQRQEIAARMKNELAEKLSPLALTVENARDVVIRGIKFTSPGGTIKGGSINVPLLKFDHSRVRLSDCVIIGGPGPGVHILNGSGAQIEKTLVAAVWGTGIVVGPGPSDSGVRIHDCDIRNCHYAGIGIGKNASDTRVERCRISGAAWHGIRYDDAAPQVLGNLLFGHARFGIYASGQTAATVRGNLFYANEMTGMACWFQSKDQIEGNTFVSNKEANLAILGASKPDIRRNIFYGGPVGVSLGNIGAESSFAKSEGTAALQDNLFWLTDHELQLRREANTTEILAIGADTGTVRIDPGFTAAASKDFSLRADSPARAQGIGAADLLPFDSPWPLQPEELAIIPKGDTRDSRQWRQPN